MASPRELLTDFWMALQMEDVDRAAYLLTEDFVITGLAAQPLDKSAFVALHNALCDAFEDLHYSLQIQKDDGVSLSVLVQMQGKLSRPLDLSSVGLGSLPATGAMVNLPPQPYVFMMEGEQFGEASAALLPDGRPIWAALGAM